MKPLLRSGVMLTGLVAGGFAVFAQWPAYPTGVPKTDDGRFNLTAPAPRAADGHPDFSGTWEPVRGPLGLGRGGPNGKGKATPPPVLPADGVPEATFWNIGAGFPEGLPLLPGGAQILAARMDQNSKDNPDAHCLPLGLMQLHMHSQPRKMIQTPGTVVILYEAQAGIRQIFTDGRKLPDPDVAQPWWYGYSVGHWEEDTLVVESNGFRDDVWLDVNGTPLTNKGRMTERFRRTNFGTMQVEVTIEDPTMYSQPFTVRVNHRLMPDTDLIEFICAENERSVPHLVGK